MKLSASYAHARTLNGTDYNAAVPKVVEALVEEGFGVLTRIDVRATLKEKLGADFPNYIILGACNPPLALQALTAEPAVGLLLPCNFVVTEDDEGDAVVGAINPTSMFTVVDNPDVAPIAAEVDAKVRRVLDAL